MSTIVQIQSTCTCSTRSVKTIWLSKCNFSWWFTKDGSFIPWGKDVIVSSGGYYNSSALRWMTQDQHAILFENKAIFFSLSKKSKTWDFWCNSWGFNGSVNLYETYWKFISVLYLQKTKRKKNCATLFLLFLIFGLMINLGCWYCCFF